MHYRTMTEALNFVVTNRIPRAFATRMMGRLSRIEQPLLAQITVALWGRFADLRLHEARQTRFTSLHACFVRELKAGARPIDTDPHVAVSPCDAVVGACGRVEGSRVFQVKGFPYTLEDLLRDRALTEEFRDGCYATLRIKASMYHRFHAPYALRVTRVRHFPGDTWNVNPPALQRVDKLFCKNERAVLETVLAGPGLRLLLVPVAAILVASIRLHCLAAVLHPRYAGARVVDCDARYEKGDEMGWFEHGSTILAFAPRGFALYDGVRTGEVIRMGQALFRLP